MLLVLISWVVCTAAQFSQVSFKTTIIDSPVDQIFWCGSSVVVTGDDDIVDQNDDLEKDMHRKIPYVLSIKGILYRSLDYGFKWDNVTDSLIDAHDLPSDYHFKDIFQSPADSNVLYLLGSLGSKSFKYNSPTTIRTENCGSRYTEFKHELKMYGFKFNKMNKNHIMAFTEKSCNPQEPDCKDQYKRQMHISQDGGSSWKVILEHVKDAAWDKLLHYELVPDTRIVAAHLLNGKQVVSYSDDLYVHHRVVSAEAFGFHQTYRYLFLLVRPDEYSQGYDLEFQPAFGDSTRPKEVILPLQDQTKHTFTVLDASEDQIFLSVSHHEDLPKLTNIYMSEMGESEKFTVSLLNNVRSQDTGQCDFEKVKSVEGVLIANIFDHSEVEKFKTRRRKSTSEKEQKTGNQFDNLDSYKKTVVSFDRGGEWHPMKAPKYDYRGQPLSCNGDCSLHLRGRAAQIVNQIYSSTSSIGIIIGTGNTGLFLSRKDEETATYLSRDGGHNWFQILNESYIYEIGDHGGLIVFAQDIKETNKILYTWDEGLTFEDIYFVTNFTIDVDNIVTEPSNMEQKFLLYGRQLNSKLGMGNDTPSSKYDTAYLRGVLVAFDFTSLHQRVCSGQWDPTMPESDYEYWSPLNYHEQKCLFGRKLKYIRRKRDAKCFNPEDIEKPVAVEPCPCSDEDWECDYGYYRKIDGGQCVLLTSTFVQQFQDQKEDARQYNQIPKNCKGTYTKSRGYRKLLGDECNGGVDLGPIEVPCPDEDDEADNKKGNPSQLPKDAPALTAEEPISLLQVSQRESVIYGYANEYKEEFVILVTLAALYYFKDSVLGIIKMILRASKAPQTLKSGRKYYPMADDEEMSSRNVNRLIQDDDDA